MKTIDEMCAVMQAFKEGKRVECRMFNYDEWEEADEIEWDWALFDYRIKPESEYVPYGSVSEVNRNKWVRKKSAPDILREIILMDTAKNEVYIAGYGFVTLVGFFNYFEYEDGTVCGKTEKRVGEQNEND